MPLQRSDAEILGRFAEALRADIHKCLPARVTAVRGARVDVQVSVNGVLFDELGTAVSVPAPSLCDIPVGVMRGGGFLVWVPVSVGDHVMLLFADRSTDTWRSGDGSPADPGWVGQHTADSAWAIPCIAPDAQDPVSIPTDKVVIGKDGADEQVLIGASEIDLGRGATSFVGLATKIDAQLQAIATTLSTLAGATFGTPYVFATVGSTAATLVKAQ